MKAAPEVNTDIDDGSLITISIMASTNASEGAGAAAGAASLRAAFTTSAGAGSEMCAPSRATD